MEICILTHGERGALAIKKSNCQIELLLALSQSADWDRAFKTTELIFVLHGIFR